MKRSKIIKKLSLWEVYSQKLNLAAAEKEWKAAGGKKASRPLSKQVKREAYTLDGIVLSAAALGVSLNELQTANSKVTDQKEKAISKFAAETVTHFCQESAQFASVVYKTRRTLSDCCAEVMNGTGNYMSDIDVYRGIVRAYFPNADVKFLMNIEINGAAPSEEEMAKPPERPQPKAKPAPQRRVEKVAAPVPAKPTPAKPKPQKKPEQPEMIQLTLF